MSANRNLNLPPQQSSGTSTQPGVSSALARMSQAKLPQGSPRARLVAVLASKAPRAPASATKFLP